MGASSGWRPPELNAIHCVCTWAFAEGESVFHKLLSDSPGGSDPPKAPSASFQRQCGGTGGSEVEFGGWPSAGCAALISPDLLRSFAFRGHLVVEVVRGGVVVRGDELWSPFQL